MRTQRPTKKKRMEGQRDRGRKGRRGKEGVRGGKKKGLGWKLEGQRWGPEKKRGIKKGKID